MTTYGKLIESVIRKADQFGIVCAARFERAASDMVHPENQVITVGLRRADNGKVVTLTGPASKVFQYIAEATQ